MSDDLTRWQHTPPAVPTVTLGQLRAFVAAAWDAGYGELAEVEYGPKGLRVKPGQL